MILEHICQSASEWDCPACRAVLYEVAPVEGIDGTQLRIPDRPTPVLPDGVKLPPEMIPGVPVLPGPFGRLFFPAQECPCPSCRTHEEPVSPVRKYLHAGRWAVWCTSCMWKVDGIYEQEEVGTASTMIEMIAKDHLAEKHPEAGES